MSDERGLKFIVVGENAVGKTCLVNRFTKNTFHETGYTVGADIESRWIKVDNNKTRINIWDTASHRRFSAIRREYYPGASAVCIVYDITDRCTFDCLTEWVNEVREHASPNIVIMLLGNKSDFEEQRQVQTEEGKDFAHKHGLDGFWETSAKTGQHVDDAFIGAIKTIYEKRRHLVAPSYGLAKTAHDYRFKYIIVGEMSVGKTALMTQFIEKVFRLSHTNKHTLAVGLGSRNVNLGGKQIRLEIWDTMGQERFNSITRSYYRDAAAVFLVYDVTKRDTFKYLPRLLKEVRNNTSPYAAMTLVGNKIDLIEERQVAKSEGKAFAEEEGLDFMEVSAKTAAKVEDIFMRAAEEIYEKIQAQVFDVNTEPNPKKLVENSNDTKPKNRCC